MEHELTSLVQKLLQQQEDLCLEFKSYWYWKDSKPSSIQKGWDEFLKDFIAMFNTYNNDCNRYIIFGFDEKTFKYNDFFQSPNENHLDCIKDLDNLKKDIIKRLNSTCKHSCEDNIYAIGDFFNIEEIKVNNHSLLLLTLHGAPFYLTLKRDLSQGMKENVIPIRYLINGSPSNSVIKAEDIHFLEKENSKHLKYLKKYEKRSSQKIVEAFQKKHFPSAKVIMRKEIREKSGIYFELFEILSEYNPSQFFIYITTFTSQEKSINLVCNEYLTEFEKASNLFILVDKENRTKGNISLERIERLFKDKFDRNKESIKVDYLENFSSSKIYKEELLEEIFSMEKPSSSNDYIPPNIESSHGEKIKSETFFKNWIEDENTPILVIKGIGGVGKTTVTRQLIYQLYKENKNPRINTNETKFLFINSHEIINELMSKDKISDLFDFYQVLADRHNITNRFNKHTFRLSADNGNLIIVLDGIDEVIAKKGSDFDVTKLMDSISNEYSSSIGKTKIIITCRDVFWSNDLVKQDSINNITILPFDNELAEQYFDNIFQYDPSKKVKAINMANNYKVNESYVPYILDMTREFIMSNDEGLDTNTFNSRLLNSNKHSHDFLIGKVCEREIRKLDNTNIDEQLELFIQISVKYSGSLNKNQLDGLLSKKLSEKNLTKFTAHPLLKMTDQTISFRYDFFEEYFKNLSLCIFFEEKEVSLSKLSDDLVDILKNYINYYNDFSSNLHIRISDLEAYKEILAYLLLELIDLDVEKVPYFISSNQNYLISSIFILLLMASDLNKEARTQLMIDTFMKNNHIKNLSLINLHNTDKKINFDFRGLKFSNCHFENFENFLECDFDRETYFKNSVFLPKLIKNSKITSSLLSNNIDNSTCRYDCLQDYFQKIKHKETEEKNRYDSFLRDVVKLFWKGSGFKDLSKQSVKSKFKNDHILLEKLIAIKFLKEKKKTTTKERKEPHYYIAEEFTGIRKILEENNTCIEFQRVRKKMML